MNPYEKLRGFLALQETNMFAMLKRLVETQSYSFNKSGNDRMMTIIASEFDNLSMTCTRIHQEIFGDHLLVRSAATSYFSKQILVVGHTDTVFPESSSFQHYTEDSQKCYGPGVIDMKGGLTAGIFAIKALEATGILRGIPVAFIFNSDEEIGSRSSSPIIREEARKSFFAFVLECGGLQGEIVTGRKGNMSIEIEAFGKAGHAASAGKDKASAVLEIAHKIISIEALNDPLKKITTNAGKIIGGVGPNTVADHALLGVDVRYENPSDRKDLEEKIGKIIQTRHVPGTSTFMRIKSQRPPMPQSIQNRQLYQRIKKVAVDLGMDVKEEFRSGVSDANLIADENTPVLDGLGPIGSKDHSENEYMIRKSLFERTLLIACAIVACWQGVNNHSGLL